MEIYLTLSYTDRTRLHMAGGHLFLHASVGHLLVNMFMLWMFDPKKKWIGDRRFLEFYLFAWLARRGYHLRSYTSLPD